MPQPAADFLYQMHVFSITLIILSVGRVVFFALFCNKKSNRRQNRVFRYKNDRKRFGLFRNSEKDCSEKDAPSPIGLFRPFV